MEIAENILQQHEISIIMKTKSLVERTKIGKINLKKKKYKA